MPRYSLNVTLYPQVFFRMLEERPRRAMVVELDSKQQAEAARFKFYGLKKALSQAGEQWSEYFQEAQQTVVKIQAKDDGKWLLVFDPIQRFFAPLEEKAMMLPVDYDLEKGMSELQKKSSQALRALLQGGEAQGDEAPPSSAPKTLREVLEQEAKGGVDNPPQ